MAMRVNIAAGFLFSRSAPVAELGVTVLFSKFTPIFRVITFLHRFSDETLAFSCVIFEISDR